MNIENIVLVDFSNLLYISAYSKFSKENGPKTSIIMHQLLWKYQKVIKYLKDDLKLDPNKTCIILATDRKSKIRLDLYTDYKIHRKEDEEKVNYQKVAFDVSTLFLTYIPNISAYADEYEADDVINKITKTFHTKDKNIFIISRDKDLWQLMKYNNVKIYDIINYKEITIEDVYNYFKLPPDKIVFHKLIYGDKSDNIKSIFSQLNIKNKYSRKVLEIIKNSSTLEEILEKIIQLYNIEDKSLFYEIALKNYKLVSLYEPKVVYLAKSYPTKDRYLNMLKDLNINKYPRFEIFEIFSRECRI